jgi:hypothetical protein
MMESLAKTMMIEAMNYRQSQQTKLTKPTQLGKIKSNRGPDRLPPAGRRRAPCGAGARRWHACAPSPPASAASVHGRHPSILEGSPEKVLTGAAQSEQEAACLAGGCSSSVSPSRRPSLLALSSSPQTGGFVFLTHADGCGNRVGPRTRRIGGECRCRVDSTMDNVTKGNLVTPMP